MIFCVTPGEYELVIKKSRFIAYSYNIETRADVKPIIDALKSKHQDARHVCYGFVADEKGDDFGYDDNGEPSGTAGKPIYSALTASGVVKSLIAVVRYFGGIKLGAGGLTRAYRESAAGVIESAGIMQATRVCEYLLTSNGDAHKRAVAVLRKTDCTVSNIMYAGEVTCSVLAPIETDITELLTPLGVRVEKTGERYAYSAIGK